MLCRRAIVDGTCPQVLIGAVVADGVAMFDVSSA